MRLSRGIHLVLVFTTLVAVTALTSGAEGRNRLSGHPAD